ncbi:MAG TPA: RNA 2',3'-cyclic phosphodiesterase [Candidatus Limnocylindrales bacterium]
MAEGDQRLFIAVPLPPAAVEACRELVEGVRATIDPKGARWVRMDGLHVTLRFLGDTAPDLVEGVGAAMRTAAEAQPPFTIALAGAGAFPSGRRPRTLWLGIEDGTAELAELSRRLGPPLSALGWPDEQRPFRPHLTVARTDAVQGTQGTVVGDALAAAASGWRVTFDATSVVLFRSVLGSGAARYERVGEVGLQG